MSESDWAHFLENPESIHALYDKEPRLEQSDLFHVLADERSDSITLGFRTYEIPTRTRPEWEGAKYNSFSFHLIFDEVQELFIHGWTAPAHKRVSIRRDPDENLTVTITSDGSSVAFRARSLSLSAARVGLVSRFE
ncbi:Imm50 family immunity protein [Streptomyces sp. NPDC012600]|uniref:Imm50 family immunity protein n=1 Tax=Streptomyces sp. NPDC012600 TaxID=3415005 RepID=UPI003C2CDB4D